MKKITGMLHKFLETIGFSRYYRYFKDSRILTAMNLLQRGLFALLLSVAAMSVQAADLDPAAVAEDCRLEGEGEGLTNDDLESYVKDCIMALLEEIDYSETDSKAAEGE